MKTNVSVSFSNWTSWQQQLDLSGSYTDLWCQSDIVAAAVRHRGSYTDLCPAHRSWLWDSGWTSWRWCITLCAFKLLVAGIIHSSVLLGSERSLSIQAAWVSLPCVGTGVSGSFKSWLVITRNWIMKLFHVMSKRTYRERYRDYFDNLLLFQATGVVILLGLLWCKSKIETEAQIRDQVRSNILFTLLE